MALALRSSPSAKIPHVTSVTDPATLGVSATTYGYSVTYTAGSIKPPGAD